MKITLKVAATLDGKIATKTGASQWITGEGARKEGHRLRSQHDAILVGINTVLADDPQLTARGVLEGKSPKRVILDSQGRIPQTSQCLKDDGIPVFVITGKKTVESSFLFTPSKADHIRVLQAPTARPEISWLLKELPKHGIQSLLVEGGAKIHASFIESKAVNHLVLFLAAKVIGGNDALSWCGERHCLDLSQAAHWNIQSSSLIGKDLMICADFILPEAS